VVVVVVVVVWRCRYPYVSHLVCNAGVAPFLNISGSLLCKQIWKNLLEFNLFEVVAHPTYVVQSTGLTSDDGLGWVWQCNVFGHYILVRPCVLPSLYGG
jgi:3-keto steroid reductase